MKFARLLPLVVFFAIFGAPTANSQCSFTISDTSPCALDPVSFSVVSPSGTYGWDFNNDGQIDAYGNNVSYTYPESFITVTYPVTLYENGLACEIENVTVLAVPDASIGVIPGSGVLEDDLIRVCSGDTDITLELYNASATYGSNVSYTINWGDGSPVETYTNATFPNTSTISHDYSGFGYYPITLTVEAANGCTNTHNYTLYNGGNPSVGLANPGNTVGLCAPATIDFPITNTGSNPTGTIYSVFVSGQLVATYSQANVPSVFSYTFLETSCGLNTSTGNYENAYDVQVVASNPCGSSQATIEPIELSTPPEVIFEVGEPTVNCEGETFVISNTSTGISEVVSGSPSTCTSLSPSWTITPGVPGVDYIIVSGNVFNSEELEIIFLTPGTYTITMEITSPSCGSGTYSESIEVFEAPDAIADITLASAASPSISDDCIPTLGSFENLSTGDSLSWTWSISPGSGWSFVDTFDFNSEDLEVLFTEEGEYTITLAATNFCGTETWDTTILIATIPEVSLDPLPTFCETATLDFSAANVNVQANYGTLSSVTWDFPGGTPSSSTDTYPTGIFYDSPGTYTVSVTVTNQCGSATTSQDFTIQEAGTVSVDPDVEVCEDADPFTVSGTPAGGTWSGPGVDPSGEFTPSDQVLGDNIITYTYQDGSCDLTETMIVTVHGLPPVDPGEDQIACVNDVPFLIDGGSPGGGVWTVNNGGVIISPNIFDPAASGVGFYTLTYSFTDSYGCTNQATKTIIVNALPPVEAGPDQSICENPNDIQLTGNTPTGGEWSGIGVTTDGVFNTNNTPGVGDYTLYYSYTNPNTGCSNIDSLVISVVPNTAADAGADETVCLNATPFEITTGTPAGGTWSGPGVNSTTNIFDPEVAGVGIHTVTYTYGTGVCETADTKTITVVDIPTVKVPTDQQFCEGGVDYDLSGASPTGGTWSGPGVNGNVFEVDVAGVGTHVLTYSYVDPTSGCANSDDMTIVVAPLPTIAANDTSYCNTPGLVELPTADPAGGMWSGPGVLGDQFDPQVAGGVGDYTLTYSYTDGNGCSNSAEVTVTVISPDNVDAGADLELCVDAAAIDLDATATPAGGSWDANGSDGLSGSSFDPAVAGVGTHTLTYTVGAGNCAVSDDLIIVINPLPIVTTMDDFSACVDAASVTLLSTPSGGTWTSNNGGVLNGNEFDPNASGAGIFNFTYTFTDNNGCTSSEDLNITVFDLPTVSSSDTSYCNTPGLVSLPAANPQGGNWSGPGLVGSSQFDPVGAGGIGTYALVYTYTDVNGCSNSTTINVTVIDPDNVNAGNDFTICIDNGNIDLSQMATPVGGSWNSNGSPGLNGSIFNPMLAGAGTHTLTYTVGAGNCAVSDDVLITVNPLPDVSAEDDFEVCVNEKDVVLSAIPAGGTWTANNGGVLGGNIFNAQATGPGIFSFTYTYTDANGCTNSDDLLVTVHDLPQLTTNDTTYCNTPGAVDLPFSTPVGGNWSGPGVANNQFDPQFAGGPGTYVLIYAYTDGNGCENTIESNVTVIEPDFVFAGNDTTVCIDGEAFDLSLSAAPLGGNWDTNGSAGLTGTIFDPAAAGVGVHTLTYHIGSGNCSVSDDIVITVQGLPEVEAGDDFAVCFEEPVVQLTGFSPAGGTWSGTGILDVQSGTFDPSIAPGDYTLVYTYADPFGCTSADSLVVMVMPLPGVDAGPDTTFCAQSIQVQLAPASPEGGIWSGTGIVDAQAGMFDPVTAGGTGTYELVYTYTDPVSGCINYDTLMATVVEPQPVEAGANDTLCIDQGMYQLTGFFPANGTWTGAGIVDAQAGLFDPEVAGGGLHTLTYTFGVGSCEVSDTKTVLVVDLGFVTAGPDETTCLTYEPITLSGYSPAGGTWSGVGIVDPVNGIFDPAVAQPGSHILTYTYVDELSGCSISPTKEIVVYPMAEADFISPEVACRNSPVEFQNLTPATYSMNWSFGDGATSTEVNPTHVYDVADTYTVTLMVENEYGCLDTVERSIIITDVPVAYFVPDTTEECVGLELSLTNESIGYDLEYVWDFGNGVISNDMNPDVVYLGQGLGDTTYVISLTVSNQCGTSAYQDIVTIHPLPNAEIGLAPQTDCSPLIMEFANISTGAATEFFWDFGNGETSTEAFPDAQMYFTDTTTSIYTVTLISGNVCGSDTATTEVVVEPANVQAVFGLSQDEGCAPLEVDFYNYATPGATIDWDFGDGNTSSENEPTHIFTEPGTYTIIQYANSDCGYDSTTLQVNVLPAPEVFFEHNQFVCLGDTVQFTNLSESLSGNFWDFGDGEFSLLNNPSHIYDEPGEYIVTLTGVSEFNQCPAEYSSTVTVLPLPTAIFEPESFYGCAPYAMEFTNISEGAEFFEWNFGDGNTSVEANPTHVYTQQGVYTVSMIATDVNGCSNDTTVVNITIHPSPIANFDYERESLCGLPADINYENQSMGANGFEWDLGNGTTTVFNDPTGSYSIAGEYNVILIASNQFGCQDTSIQDVRIYPEPKAEFVIDADEGCQPLSVTFNNVSQASNSFRWSFGTGETSIEDAPTYVYEDAGIFDVELIATVDDACSDTITLTDLVTVHETPFANFEAVAVATEQTDGTYEMVNLSEGATNFFWEFSDGFTTVEPNPTHRFDNNSVYQIYLEASTDFGCVDDTLMRLTPEYFNGLFIPNGFSPEQGIGDVRLFRPKGVGLKEYHMQVFSAYGELLWESRELEEGQPAQGWDGTVNGQIQPQDVYVWKCFAIFEDGTVWRGEKDKNGNYKTMGSLILLR